MTVPRRKLSRHFTVVVRRDYDLQPETLFAAWTDPDIRGQVIAPPGKGLRLKQLDIAEGGVEIVEERWRDRPGAETTRCYVALRPCTLIVAQVVHRIKTGARTPDNIVAAQELLLFKPTAEGARIVASSQVTAMKQNDIQAAEDAWNDAFDRFEDQLDPQHRGIAP
ncbi:MAG: SRPBCC domain-containing protein [Rhodobacter sp.]|nr:SRPBCC domain-containing protein [Rhodobacter sp.]